jgi:hypothetical protein
MCRNRLLLLAITILIGSLVSPSWADVPAPPVNQVIGLRDVLLENQTEATCRACHDSGVPDRHHLLYNEPIEEGDFVPYPDTDGDGVPDTNINCMSCHGTTFTVERDCTVCHKAEESSPGRPVGTVHHSGEAASSGDCVSCHGDIVDNFDDGHYIPEYEPSLVTPLASEGEGEPLNSRGHGAGACNYCHDADNEDPALAVIRDNHDLHHYAGRAGEGGLGARCNWCHISTNPYDPLVRSCERCHGPDSLHNIQADSPKESNIGTIVVGGEDAGYGHVGRDAGPGDSDCWGCHGFAMAEMPALGRLPSPLIPTVYESDRNVIKAGTEATLFVAGAALTNTDGGEDFTSDVELTDGNGSSVVLVPDMIMDQGMLAVTIPGSMPAGNYELRAVKEEFASNPTVISVVPNVRIIRAAGRNGVVTIRGTGFSGYAKRSGTAVRGRFRTVQGGRVTNSYLNGTISSWEDGRIVVRWPGSATPNQVTIRTVFGNTTAPVAAAVRRQ